VASTPRIGDRVRIVGLMTDDPDPLPVGAAGTVTDVGRSAFGYPAQIHVDWDPEVGRTLILLATDPFEILR